jgi:hypothetical protein
MYHPKSYFSINILKQVLDNYNWLSKYTLQETNSGDVIIRFPKCSVIISEGFESNMNAYFPNSETKRNDKQSTLNLFDAVDAVKSIRELENDFIPPKELVQYFDIEPSLEKVKQGLNNICILLQTYLLPCIEGDFSWVEEYNKKYPDVIL